MSKTTLRVVYWSATLLFAIPIVWSAFLYFSEAPKMVATMLHLGYPMYFLKILGTAKLLGVAAILIGRFPRLKEWAYAGFTFDLLGAACSHLASGDSVAIASIPLGFLVLVLASYGTWKALRSDMDESMDELSHGHRHATA